MADYPVTPLTPPLSEQEIIRRQKLQALMVSYCPHLGARVWKLVRWVKGLKN